MYATKTKKITSYGRRAQRFVAVGEERPSTQGNTDDMAVLIGKGTTSHRDSLSPSPPANSPRDPRFRRLIANRRSSPKVKLGLAGKSSSNSATARPPLGTFSTNMPGSPARPPKRSPKRAPRIGKGTPLRVVSNGLFAPLVDMDIIVLDGAGRRISQERRLSRPDVQANVVGDTTMKAKGKEIETSKVQRMRRVGGKAAVHPGPPLSDFSSESDPDEYVPTPALEKVKRQGNVARRQTVRSKTKLAFSHVVLSSNGNDFDVSDDEFPEVPAPRPTRRAVRARAIVLSSGSESESPRKPKRKAKSKSIVDISKDKGVGSSRLQAQPNDQAAQPGGGLNPEATQVSRYLANPKPHPLQYQVEVVVPSLPKLAAALYISESTNSPPKDDPPPAARFRRPPSLEDSYASGHLHLGYGAPPPTPRPRQLTPMRPNRSTNAFGHRAKAPPSLTSPVDTADLSFDLSLDLDVELERLNITSGLQPLSDDHNSPTLLGPSYALAEAIERCMPRLSIPPPTASSCPLPAPVYLRPLLAQCTQEGPVEFAKFIETFPLDPMHASGPAPSFSKIGEASYSEVFGIGDVVLKVIPLRNQDQALESIAEVEDTPFPSDAKDVLKEIIVTKAMGEICGGFIKLLRTHVVQGTYPPLLLSLWDEYNKRKGSEGIRPDSFPASQMFAIIILPNGGPDLEAFTFATPSSKMGWRQACSVFWQVVKSLAKAEDLVRFEHRDLHWGQILVKHNGTVATTQPKAKTSRKIMGVQPPSAGSGEVLPMDDAVHGVQATIIDLGLARIDRSDPNEDYRDTYWTPFDQVIFEGEGDYQFDIYRMMKEHNGDSWEDYRPLTNVMWLHYLCVKLIHAKRLRPPALGARKSISAKVAAATSQERMCYECLKEVEDILGKSISAATKKPATKGRGRRKTQAPGKAEVSLAFQTAGDVLKFAVDRGWIA